MGYQRGYLLHSALPMLDLYIGFPIDAMHCELRLPSYLHEVLIEEIFSTVGVSAYSDGWESINVPSISLNQAAFIEF